MENNVAGNNQGTQNSGTQEPRCRDRRAEKEAWKEDRRAWRREQRGALWPFHGLFWGLGLVLLGVLFLLDQQGVLTGGQWWQWFLVGLGGIFIIDAIVRYRIQFLWGAWGKFITGAILVLVGVLFLAGVSHWWPIILLAAGVLFLGRFFWHINQADKPDNVMHKS
jgi:hypothetical protein